MAKSPSPAKQEATCSTALPPSPIRVEVIGPFDEPYCLLYRYRAGGFFNIDYKRAADVTLSLLHDSDTTIYKMARGHVAVIRHQKLDNLKGTLEIFEGPKVDLRDSRPDDPDPIENPPPVTQTCLGPCPDYERPCLITEYPDCVGDRLECLDRVDKSPNKPSRKKKKI
jgi:hypothetical protein